MKRIVWFALLFLILPCFALASSELSQGDTGEEVRSLQQQLIHLELLSGKDDGIYGSQTSAAVSEAQRLLEAAGYPTTPTGKADQTTLALLFDPSAEEALRTLRFGSKGVRVRSLQTRLIDLKLLDGNADGAYGTKTEAAVLAFQRKINSSGLTSLPEDGVATPAMVELLQSDLNDVLPSPLSYDASAPLSLTPDHLYAKSCILIDAPSGTVLFENEADVRLYPASTTKMMTLLLALEQCDTDEVITIPACASDVPADSSLVPVYPGEKMQMSDLLYGLMMRSGNDAANAVAELCAGSIDAFVLQMNQRAREIGMVNTSFVNPHGYHDENHYSTARDLALLTRHGLTLPQFCEMVTCLNHTLAPTRLRDELVLTNSYDIFNPLSEYFIEGAAGVKSDYTSHAGFCYAGAAQRGGRTLIAVILGVPGRDRGWTDLKRLFEYGFALE